MRRRVGLAAALLLAGLVAAVTARAHDQPYSFVDLRLVHGRIEGQVMAHVEDLALATGLTPADSLLSPGRAASALGPLHAALATRLGVHADGAPLALAWDGWEAVPERKLLAFRFHADVEPRGVRIEGPMFPADPLHETYVNVYRGDTLALQDVLTHDHREAVWGDGARQGTWAVVRTFVLQGVHHIFLGPDHILFVIGLLLLGGGLGRLLKIVTAFTVAHSVTLALATLALVAPSPRVIEPAIALSIVCVGVENLIARGRRRDVRVPLAFAFGLIHGFGFANVLRAFGLPSGSLGAALASFNVGVELGQASIVLAVAPGLAWIAARRPRLGHGIVVVGSACVIAAGAWWLIERLFLAA